MLDKLYMDYVSPMRGSPRYHQWTFLTCVSAALERRVWLDKGRNKPLFPNLYTFLVGAPATGKGTCAEIGVSLLNDLKYKLKKSISIGPSKITSAALYERIAGARKTVTLPQTRQVVPHSPLFIYASELGVAMEDFGGGTLTNDLIDFWDSKGFQFIVEKQTLKGGLIQLHNPSLTFLGCTTEDYLRRAAGNYIVNSGLSSRIMFIVENRRVEKQWDYIEPDDILYHKLLMEFARIFDMRGPMKYTPEGHAAWKLIGVEADEKGHNCTGEFLKNYYGRKQDNTSKIAMAIAAIKGKYLLGPDEVGEALAYIEDIEPQMGDAFAMRSIEKDDDLSTQILKHLVEGKWTSEKDLHLSLQSQGKFLPSNGNMNSVMNTLRTTGRLKTQVVDGITMYFLSPKDEV